MPYKDKEKQREFQREWCRKRREDFFADKACICGSTINLELDHIDESKKITHRIWSWSEKRRNEELAKCQILCEACHKEKTSQYLQRPINHGTTTGYKRGCRCKSCHEALLQYWRNRRANIPE